MPLRWTKDEITHLRSVSILHSHVRGRKLLLFPAIKRHFPNRSTAEIRSKYSYLERKDRLENQLRPSAFTTEESWILHVAVRKFDMDFKLVREVYFRAFSETKIKQRYYWQLANGWDDKFFAQYFPLLKGYEWKCEEDVVNQQAWDGFLGTSMTYNEQEEQEDEAKYHL